MSNKRPSNSFCNRTRREFLWNAGGGFAGVALSGMLAPEVREKLHGHVEIRKVYKASKLGNIGGCFVTDGHVQRGSKIRLTRGGVIITEDLSIDSLKRVKDDVREVKAGLECGIKLANYDDIKVGDILEAYIRETIQRTL